MDSNLKSQNDINNFESKTEDIGVILVSHGSSLPYAEETFKKICEKFIKSSGIPSSVGYMKVSNPTIPQAIKDITSKNPNIKRIIAIPVFLAQGIHTNIDIPIILGLDPLETDPRCPSGVYPKGHYLYGLEEIDFPGEIKLLPPIGPHKGLLDIINIRINEALASSKLDSNAKTGILLVSHGSRLKYNREFISKVQSNFNEITEYPNDFAFMELQEPSIPATINKLTSENDIERLIVVPVFIAPGVHTTSDIPTILGLKEKGSHSHSHSHSHDHSHGHSHSHSHGHSHTHDLEEMEFDGEVLYPDPIGSDDILIKILINKLEESL